MEQRITRQTVKDKSNGNIQLNDHNKKKIRRKKAKSLAKKSSKKVSNASLQSSMVSALFPRKRKCDQIIKEPKAKVAKASVPSTKTKVAKASVPSTKTKVAKASVPSTKTKVAKASVRSTKTKVAKASAPSTKTKVAKASVRSTKTKVDKASVRSTKTKVAKASVPSTKTKVAKASVRSTKTKVAKASVPSTKTKVAKASVRSTKTKVAKASVPSTKTKVAKASVPSTKTKVAKASVRSTKTKVAKASVPSTTTTAKKNKRYSKDSSIPRTEKRERGRLCSLQHHRTKKPEEINSKDIKSDSIKPKKSTKVKRQQRIHLKVTSLTCNSMMKRKRTKALDLKSERKMEKNNQQKKKLLITKPPNKSRRQRLPSKDIQFDKIKETTDKTSFIHPYLSFDTNLPNLVSNICCVDQNTLWIGRMAYGSILKVTYNSSKTLTIVKEFKHPQCDFYDFCYDGNKDQILYTDRRNNSIMSISSKYKLTKFKCVKPLKPTCITISPDDFIFCGLVDEYSYQASPKREIVKMAKNGTIIMRIPSINDNLVRFSMSHRIAIHPNNDIVIAANDINGGVILIFDPEGQSKYSKTVTGPGVRFQPRGLTISRGGDIVVCNESNGEIYIYDVKGQLMETIKSQSIGITDIPWSLAFDSSGHLVIGTMVNYQPNVPTICFAEYLYR
ncbi:uncharacterized protein LOC134687532 [Mytilus trossulus]|uniref:uncharacterized protein LOC134687532 n=1 Tax=Mytilus trossulus TaxID=6551 RepID=UPI0030064B06